MEPPVVFQLGVIMFLTLLFFFGALTLVNRLRENEGREENANGPD